MTARKRIWKRLRPLSLAHAFELCSEHAGEVLRRPPKVMAEMMGVPLSTYYRWISECDMPTVRVRQFETLTGAHYVSDYLALADGERMVVPMPTGRRAGEIELSVLQAETANAIALLVNFYGGVSPLDRTREALECAMAGWVYHHANIAKVAEPELDFGEESR